MNSTYLDKIQLGIKCTNSYWSSTQVVEKLEKSDVVTDNQEFGLFFIEENPYSFWRLYFYIQDILKVNWSFFKGKTLMAEILVRDSKKEKWNLVLQEFQNKGGFKLYDTYIRLFKEKPEIDSSGIDFSNVEVAQEIDLVEIQGLLLLNFDVRADRIPSLEELKELIETTFLIKEDGRIVAFFITEKRGVTLIYRFWLVLQLYRGKKYGTILMNRVLTFDPTIERITSWISLKKEYSILAHKRLGFKEDGLRNYLLLKEI